MRGSPRGSDLLLAAALLGLHEIRDLRVQLLSELMHLLMGRGGVLLVAGLLLLLRLLAELIHLRLQLCHGGIQLGDGVDHLVEGLGTALRPAGLLLLGQRLKQTGVEAVGLLQVAGVLAVVVVVVMEVIARLRM